MEQPPKISAAVLDPEHYHPLISAIRNLLSTDLAAITFAQLIDGLPLVDTVWDMRGSLLLQGHPLINHDHLCDGAMEQLKAFRDVSEPDALTFDSRVMQRYQNAAPGSRDFSMRLVELAAASIHQIAVLLFQSDTKLHDEDYIASVVSWKRETQWVDDEYGRHVCPEQLEPRPTLFYHVNYMDYEQYPHGLADVAGYWAEDRVFGGIAVFDRGESGIECKDIYFHSGRQETTFRVWRLQDEQFDRMISYLLSANDTTPSPFPILASSANRHRHDPWDAIALHHIFRDPWERKIPPTKPPDRDVRTVGDYPELEDMWKEIDAAVQRSPEMEFTWTAADEAERFPWMHRHQEDADPGEDAANSSREASESGEVDSLRIRSPPRTPPPPTPIGSPRQGRALPTQETIPEDKGASLDGDAQGDGEQQSRMAREGAGGLD